MTMRNAINRKKHAKTTDVGNGGKSRSSKANVGLDALLVTVRDSLHLGQALGFEAPLAAASTV